LELLLLLVIKAIPVKVFGKWGSAVAEAMAGQGGEENLFSKRFLPHKTVLQHPPFPHTPFSIKYALLQQCPTFWVHIMRGRFYKAEQTRVNPRTTGCFCLKNPYRSTLLDQIHGQEIFKTNLYSPALIR